MHIARRILPLKVRVFRRAVVIGGSIAGLLAARVLSDHFDEVTLIERDVRDDLLEPRKGVPQGRHPHALLLRGKAIIDALFPGLLEELCEAGGVIVGSGREFAWHHGGQWRVQFETDLSFISMTRPLLETKIAERVYALPNVRVMEGTRVTSLRVDNDGNVLGVQVDRPRDDVPTEQIEADLVVDAAGRGSSTPQWLTGLGFEAPRTEFLKVPVVYASCMFRRTIFPKNWRTLIVTGAPSKRFGFVLPVEDGRWLVGLASFFDESAPEDHRDFMTSARSFTVPDVYEVLRDCQPLSEVVHYRFPGSQRRRYERLTRFVTGDAVCSFNPVFGQGMTVCAIEAECLHGELTRAKRGGGITPEFSRRWFRTVESIVDVAWGAISIEDLRFPEIEDERPFRLRLLQWYMGRVHRATYRSRAVTEQFYRVVSFLILPPHCFGCAWRLTSFSEGSREPALKGPTSRRYRRPAKRRGW